MSGHLLHPAAPASRARTSVGLRRFTRAIVGRRARIGLVAFAAAFALGALAASSYAATSGPVLVIAAHPDDEALPYAGVIESALTAGRPVYVAVVTNGAAVSNPISESVCGAADGAPAGFAKEALERNAETEAAMTTLGGSALAWTTSLATSHVFFLGYPDGGLTTIAGGGTFSDPSGLNQTFADGGDTTGATCNGDYHYLRTGAHAALTAANLSGDLAALLAQVQPTDVYTHAVDDGHPDHATVARLVIDAIRASTLTVDLHSSLVHETGDTNCQAAAAAWWPNPENVSDPAARSTPGEPFAAFGLFGGGSDVGYATCPDGSPPVAHDWGPLGPPTERIAVPADMQATDLTANKKWQVLSQYASQLGCPSGASCGYMHAFVKSDEILWSQRVSATGAPVPIGWPGLTSTNDSQVGATLSVRWPSGTTAADAFRGGASYAYQWLRCDPSDRWQCTAIAGATDQAYTVAADDRGSVLRLAVTATNGGGTSPAVYSGTTDEIPTPPANTAPPSISGTATTGATLTAAPGTWSGLPAPTFTYVWQSSPTGTSGWTAIAGATASTYVVAGSLAGSYLRVEVTATNSEGSVSALSGATAQVTSAPVNTAAPAISGTATVGETLTVTAGTWSALPAAALSYEWQSSADGSTGWTMIDGATSATLVVGPGVAGLYLRVVEVATNSVASASEPSAATASVTAKPSNGAPPVVTGTFQVGQTLTVVPGFWTGTPTPTLAEEWQSSPDGVAGWITVGTGASLTLDSSLALSFVRVVETATNGIGPDVAVSSTPTLVQSQPSGGGGGGGGGGGTSGGSTGGSGTSTSGSSSAGAPTATPPAAPLAPDLHVTVTADAPSTPAVGATVTFHVVVANRAEAGPAGQVVLEITIPAGFTITSSSTSNGTCAPGGAGLVCSLGALAPGARNEITVAGLVGSTQPQTLVAAARQEAADANVADDSASLTVAIVQPAIAILSAKPASDGAVSVRVSIDGWTIAATATSPGSGYWIVYVDGKVDAISHDPAAGLTTALAPGKHWLSAELLNADGTQLSPRVVSRRVAVTIPVAPKIAIVSAKVAAHGRVTLKVKIAGWKINATHPASATARSGYWRIIVDGRTNATSRKATVGSTTTLKPGLRHVRVELVRENGGTLSPGARSQVVTVRIPPTPKSHASH